MCSCKEYQFLDVAGRQSTWNAGNSVVKCQEQTAIACARNAVTEESF
jgi:hypothetical protein